MYKSSDKTHEICDQYHFYFSAYTIKSYVYNHKKKNVTKHRVPLQVLTGEVPQTLE